VHIISRGNREHDSNGNNGATYHAIGDAGASFKLVVRWGWVHVHGTAADGNGSGASSWQIAISGGAAMFLLISLGMGLLRPYLRRLKIQRARGQYLSGPVVHTELKFG